MLGYVSVALPASAAGDRNLTFRNAMFGLAFPPNTRYMTDSAIIVATGAKTLEEGSPK